MIRRGVPWRGPCGWLMLVACVLGAGCTSPTGPTLARWSSALPQLLCPPAVTIPGALAGMTEVAYDLPTVIGETAVESLACVPASGSAFPLGATTVFCTGTDARRRQARCGFTVSVTPLQLLLDRLVAFGDSVTLGENALPGPAAPLFIDLPNAYPTRLQSRVDRDFPTQAIAVINDGLSGENVTDGLVRLAGVIASRDPDAVLLLHGYNDLNNEGVLAVTRVADRLRDMVRLARTAEVPFVFVSTITPSRPGQRQISPAAILQVNFLIRQMADVEGAVLVDAFDAFFGQEATLVGDDGLHLTPAGNEVLADAFYEAIRARVPSLAALAGR